MLSISCFGFGVFAFAWIVAGYPLLLKILVKRRARPVLRGSTQCSVSVLIPVHNGALFLRRKIISVLRQEYPRILMEILVLSDGSTDETDEIVREFESEGVKLLRLDRGGKTAALRVGIRAARNEILVLTDVRQELDPRCVAGLVSCFDDPSAGVVSGELRIRSGSTSAEVDIGMYWRFETWLRRQLACLDSIFGATGPIYAMRRSLASGVDIPPEILLDDAYLPLTAFFKGYRLVVDESALAFDYPHSLKSEFRRKVRTLSGNYQLIRYMPQLLTRKNRMLFHFLSYKVGRLMLPYICLLIAVSSWFLPRNIAVAAALAEGALVALLVADYVIPEGFPLKRISSPLRTFFTMMVATVCAVQVFFIEPLQLWKAATIIPQMDAAIDNSALQSESDADR
jgi:cellulose synthase/poly-beta-1,6-N-acetylglucosamine synthase-like glycosyltransferase